MHILFLILAMMCCASLGAQSYEQKTNLPHIFINTYDGRDITSKTTYVQGVMRRVGVADTVEVFDSLNIRGRGNSTWNMAKKPYRLKFNKKEKFLGKGHSNAKSWTLIANHGDKTMMRNALTQLMGEWIGLKRCPAHEFVDLTLNNAYRGTYMVSDHVEVRAHRVNVEEQDYPLTETSDISGGYLFEFDGFSDGNGFRTSRSGSYIRIHYPDEDEIAGEQNQYARQFFSEIETRLYASDFKDSVTGYRAMMDTTSLVNWYLATEICANIDGFFSTYCYKYRGDNRLYWGPLWDYDIAYGNDTRKGDTSRKLMLTEAYSGSQAWVQRMWQDEWFQQAVARRFRDLRQAGLDSFMLAQIDSLQLLLDASQQENFRLWGINKKAYHERVLYSTYDEYVRDLRDFVKAHNEYLSTQFVVSETPEEPNEPDEPDDPIGVEIPDSVYCLIANIGSGTVFDVEGSAVCGWHIDDVRRTQLWDIQPTASGHYQLFNAESGLALLDPDEGLGAQLTVGAADDAYSLWTLMPQGQYVNLINEGTGRCANLSGGGRADGTAILSYTSDSKNATSNNRRWAITPTDELLPIQPEEPGDPDDPDTPDNPDDPDTPDNPDDPDTPDNPDDPGTPDNPDDPGTPDNPDDPDTPDNPDDPGTPDDPDDPGTPDDPDDPGTPEEPTDPEIPDIVATAPVDYALAYDPMTQELHFGSSSPLHFTAQVFMQNGKLVGRFNATERYSLRAYPAGIYIVTWQMAGRRHSIKFQK